MKNIKKIIALILTLSLAVVFAGCGSKDSASDKPTIGIIQFGSHASLNNCYDGIMQGLEESGINADDYTIEYVNSNFDASVSQTQANNLVNKNAKVIIAIATPSAVAAANAAADKDVPVVYCAITDATVMAEYENVTGSSDIPNFEKQLEVVTGFMNKTALKIGVLYSTEESSSPVQVESLKKAAEKYSGMEILDSAVADINTIDSKTNELIDRGVDCFVNLLDNTIVGKLETNILPITNEKKIPVFGSEIEQVKVGCAASASIDYIVVGASAGKSAAEILGGKSASDIPVAYITEPTNYYNSEVCTELGLTVPTTITVEDVAE
ncbi:MAG: ABC transporter substrate-binding protein [Acutalibacteraceae bacterium]|nr:ABC transporter substrate-binding protein [Acutalibacteraceae bacterium]